MFSSVLLSQYFLKIFNNLNDSEKFIQFIKNLVYHSRSKNIFIKIF